MKRDSKRFRTGAAVLGRGLGATVMACALTLAPCGASTCLAGPEAAAEEIQEVAPSLKAKLLARTAGTWLSKKGRKDVRRIVMDGKGAYEARDAKGVVVYKGSLRVYEDMEDVYCYALVDEKGKDIDGDFAAFTLDNDGELHFGNDEGWEYRKAK